MQELLVRAVNEGISCCMAINGSSIAIKQGTHANQQQEALLKCESLLSLAPDTVKTAAHIRSQLKESERALSEQKRNRAESEVCTKS